MKIGKQNAPELTDICTP